MEEKAYSDNRAYEYFGCHRQSNEAGKYRYVFRLMQNSACGVELSASFLSKNLSLSKNNIGVWELIFESNIPIEGMSYRYKVLYESSEEYIRDPFSFNFDSDEGGGTIVEEPYTAEMPKDSLGDIDIICQPLNICRIRLDDVERLNYRDLSEKYLSEIKALKFTHAEIATINAESCFAPSPHYGMPSDFKAFVGSLKREGIGVFLQLCLSFEVDDEIYSSFIISAVLYWFRCFGIDGVRFDLGELAFPSETLLKDINRAVKAEFPNSIIIADGTARYGKVTTKESDGGLGFDFMLDRGWSRDMLEYVRLDPLSRNRDNKMLTFSFSYACAERFILPITENEVEKIFLNAIGKGKKLKDIFVLIGMMITHPGKKMLSSELVSVDRIRRFMIDINALYLTCKELFELDSSENGFRLIDVFSKNSGIVAYKRFSKARGELLCIMNFSDFEQKGCEIEDIDRKKKFEEIFNSTHYTSGCGEERSERSIYSSETGRLELDVPPYSIIIFKLRKNSEKMNDKG